MCFLPDEDRFTYLQWLGEALTATGGQLHAFQQTATTGQSQPALGNDRFYETIQRMTGPLALATLTRVAVSWAVIASAGIATARSGRTMCSS